MCRTGVLVWGLLCIMVLGYRIMQRFHWERTYLYLFTAIPGVLSVLTMVIPVVARNNGEFSTMINKLLTGRVDLINQDYEQVWTLTM